MLPHFPHFKLTTHDYIMFSTDASNLSFTVCDHSPFHLQFTAHSNENQQRKDLEGQSQVGEVCGLTALLN